jgi:Secretion system C-terminal sorting domain/SprB repeat
MLYICGMKKLLFSLVLLFTGFNFAQNDTITIVSYNLLNFPDGRTDCGATNINPPNRTDSLRKILRYLKPDIFVACEIQTKDGADSVLTRSLNVFGTSFYQMAPFLYSGGGGGELNNAMYYNSNKLIFLRQKAIVTNGRDINHYTLMVKDPNIAQHRDTIFVEVHMAHLKAGSAAADQTQRAEQTQVFRTYVESKPKMRNHFFCGDLNVYQSSELGYQNLITGGNNPFFDPIFQLGNWTNNSSFAAIHTQSPRLSGSWACGSTGGMDDRFDQILVTQNVLSGVDRLSYLNNSYKAVGNDGQHYNSGLLNAPTNALYPDSVVRAIYYLSDHLPVVMKVKPTLPTSNGLGLTYAHNGPLCQGNTNGTATVTPLYGQTPFTYAWDSNAGNQTTATASNLGPGSYCVTVTDATGMSDVVCFEIASIAAVNASAFPNGSTYLCDGQATIIVSGGTGPYTFSWNDPLNQTTQTATGLCPGNYICTVSDQGTCDVQVTAVIALVGLLENAVAEGKVLAFPNPFDDQVEIRNYTSANYSLDKIILRDLQGKIVSQWRFATLNSNDSIFINTQELSKGVYFVELIHENQISRFKMMK